MSKVLHWFIQKPIKCNKPVNENYAVFQEFKPYIHMQGCEWLKVVKHEDYSELEQQITNLKKQIEILEKSNNYINDEAAPPMYKFNEVELRMVMKVRQAKQQLKELREGSVLKDIAMAYSKNMSNYIKKAKKRKPSV